MNYKIKISDFEGPLDLLLHLIKESDIDICNIKIEEITNQYLEYIHEMEELQLDIASEYLVMAAELIELKSNILLPRPKAEESDEYEEDPREQLIQRLLEYKKYKEVSNQLKEFELERKEIHTKEPSDLREFQEEGQSLSDEIQITDLLSAFQKFLERKNLEQPLNTKITKREYSVGVRSNEIRRILKEKQQVEFGELFEVMTKDYIVVTFLSILDLAKKQELDIKQEDNFNKIYLIAKE